MHIPPCRRLGQNGVQSGLCADSWRSLFEMGIKAAGTFHGSIFHDSIELCLVFGKSVTRKLAMIKVMNNGTTINQFPVTTEMIQANTDVGILQTPAVIRFIKPIDGD